MAENLLSRWAFTKEGEPSTILSVSNIHDYLDHANMLIKPISGKDILNPEIEGRIKTLQIIAENYEKREKKIYKHYGCEKGGLAELQQKIDAMVEALEPFQNKVLRNFPLIKALNNSMVTLDQISEAVLTELNKEIQSKTFDQVISEMVDKMLEERKKYGNPAQILKSHLIQAFKFDKKNRKISLRETRGLQGYRKELKNIYVVTETPEGVQFIIQTEEPSTSQLTYYPYYDLTAQQKEQALTDVAMWNAFTKSLIALISNSGAKEAAKEIFNLNLMTVEDFFIASPAELIGILGEFQSMVLFAALEEGPTNLSQMIKFVGNTKHEAKKVGIDMLLLGEGIQIKNYNTYGVAGVNEGLNLNETLTLENFLGKLESTLTTENVLTLAEYYTAKAYHVRVNSDFNSTLSRLSLFEGRMKDFFEIYVNYYLPLDAVPIDGFRTANLFYFIGGRRLVPISKIIFNFVKYLTTVLSGEAEGLKRTFTTNMEYTGTTYRDYYKTWPGKKGGNETKKTSYESTFSYNNIYSKIRMRYNFNFNIDYILRDIITNIE